MVVRPALAAVDVTDLIASYLRIVDGIDRNDPHDRLLPIRAALRREVDWLRAGLVQEPVEPPRAARPVRQEVAEEAH